MIKSVGYDFLKLPDLLKQNAGDWLFYLNYMAQKGEIEIFLRDTKQ